MSTLNEILKSVGVSAQEKAEVGSRMFSEAESAAFAKALRDAASIAPNAPDGGFLMHPGTAAQLINEPTDWHVGTFTPGQGGEYEVLHPITGMIERAEYDPLFEAWSCEWQYPTWRGLRGAQ